MAPLAAIFDTPIPRPEAISRQCDAICNDANVTACGRAGEPVSAVACMVDGRLGNDGRL